MTSFPNSGQMLHLAPLIEHTLLRPDATDADIHDRIALIDAMRTRRSVPTTSLGEPGPDADQLRRILRTALRVPDHGMLKPWRFIVISGYAREQTSRDLSELYAAENTAMDPDRLRKFKGIMSRLFTYAPLAVIVVADAREHDTVPIWDQHLSSGAVCMAMLLAVHGMGFHGNWLSGWVAASAHAHRYFGLADNERVAGVINIGTAVQVPEDRRRPDIDDLVTVWSSRNATNAMSLLSSPANAP